MRILFTYLVCLSSLFSFAQTEATLLGTWSNSSLIGSAAFDNTYNEIWGYASNGKEYAIIGSTAGTHFIDVTNPNQPTELFLIPGADNGANIIHRDYHDLDGYLYVVCDEGQSTLQIMDLRYLPERVDVLYDSNELLRRSHNIFIDEENKRLYALIAGGGPSSFDAMRVYDISNPLDPILLSQNNSIEGFSFSQVHDGYIRDNIAYLNLGPGGFCIADFTNPAAPKLLGSLTDYPQSGYNHSGWLSNDGNYYYMADETWGTDMKVLDVSDPSDIQITNFIDAGNPASTSIPHNQVVACDYLYVSYYYDGLQVYDISDPSAPVRSHFYETSNEPDAQNYKGAWGVYPFLPSGNVLVADMQEGLFVFQAIDLDCSEDRSSYQNIFIVSTDEIEQASDVSITPNPASEAINVQIQSYVGTELLLEIFDLNGKLLVKHLENGSASNFDISINHLPKGLYTIRVNGKISQKLVKL